jgi:hypothetical protein
VVLEHRTWDVRRTDLPDQTDIELLVETAASPGQVLDAG